MNDDTGVILVDADIIAYRVGFACESTAYSNKETGELFLAKEVSDAGLDKSEMVKTRLFEPDNIVLYTVREYVRSSIIEPMESTFPGYFFRFYLTGGNNYREEYATIQPYKGNRVATTKPAHMDLIRDTLVNEFGAVVVTGQEADDEIAIEAYRRFETGNDDYVIVTVDKDLNMIPGKHFNPVKGKGANISEEGADRNFWYQLLTGDRVDNILGLPGIGEKRAKAIMRDVRGNAALYNTVMGMYRKTFPQGCPRFSGGSASASDALLENAILLWMRRHPGEIWNLGLMKQHYGEY